MPPPQQCPCNFRYVAQFRRSQHSHLLRAYRGVLLALGRQHTHRYRLADALTNISCGMTSQVVGVFLRIVGVGAYTAVYQNFALLHSRQSWTAGLLLFLLADLGYYWAHRLSQINLFWGSHVMHH